MSFPRLAREHAFTHSLAGTYFQEFFERHDHETGRVFLGLVVSGSGHCKREVFQESVVKE